MNSTELSKKVWANLEDSQKKAAKFEDLVAVSFTLISENDENLYVTVKNGQLEVAPYRYDDNNCELEATAEIVDELFSGALSFDKALSDGSVQVKRGDAAKFKALECLVPAKKTAAKSAASKPAEKKAAAKTETPKSEPAKTEPAKAAESAAKPAEAPKAAEETKTAAPAPKPAASAAKPMNNNNKKKKK